MLCYLLVQDSGLWAKIGESKNPANRIKSLNKGRPEKFSGKFIVTCSGKSIDVEHYIKTQYLKTSLIEGTEFFNKTIMKDLVSKLKRDRLMKVRTYY